MAYMSEEGYKQLIEDETDLPKAHSAHGGGDRGKPPGPERQAAGGGEAQAPGKAGLSGQTVGYQGETE